MTTRAKIKTVAEQIEAVQDLIDELEWGRAKPGLTELRRIDIDAALKPLRIEMAELRAAEARGELFLPNF